MNRRHLAVAVVLISLACGRPTSESGVDRVNSKTSALIPALMALGERCEPGTRSCSAGLCANLVLGTQLSAICTVRCADENDCPSSWHCQTIEQATAICVPPAQFTPARASIRVRSRLATPPTSSSPTRALDGGP